MTVETQKAGGKAKKAKQGRPEVQARWTPNTNRGILAWPENVRQDTVKAVLAYFFLIHQYIFYVGMASCFFLLSGSSPVEPFYDGHDRNAIDPARLFTFPLC